MTAKFRLPRKSLIPLSIAVVALPIAFFGCSSGGGGGDDAGVVIQGAAQINATAVQDSVTWITTTVPGCKLNTGAASAASVAAVQEGVAGASVVRQVMSVIAEAKKAGGGSFASMAVQQFAGDCGGSLNVSDVHANGITTYTYAFSNFCSLDSTVSPPQQTKVDGTMTAREIGTPSDSGPIVSAMEFNANQLAVTAKDGTTTLTVNNARVAYGVPDTWSPGAPTASNPDRISIEQATVRFQEQNRIHTVSNFNASTYESGGNSVTNISDGRYATTSHGYLNLATGQSIVMNVDGRWISGSLSLTGSDGIAVLVTPSSTKDGVMNIALNGQPIGAGLDCSGALGQVVP